MENEEAAHAEHMNERKKENQRMIDEVKASLKDLK